jgi:GT2 family glycosyltransferase
VIKHSIIGVTIDRPDYLEEAIRSIENQTEQDYEHFIFSKDQPDSRSHEILRAAKARRPDKFFYTLPGGDHADIVGRYWNILLGFARGQFITILDDDNRKRPNFLAEMTAPMDAEPAIEAVTCGWSIIDGDGRLTGEDRHLNLRTSMQHLWWDNSIDSNAVVFRRSIVDKIGQFDPTLTTNEDWDFMIRLVRHCTVVHLESSLLEYREHGGSRSRRALDLGAHENWRKIRESRFTAEENAAARR